MKQKDIEKRLREDVESVTPNDFSAVWKKCEAQEQAFGEVFETERELVAVGGNGVGGGQRSGRRARGFIALATALLLVLSVCVGWAAGWFSKKSPFDKGSFIIDINPSVEVTYDEKGMTTAVTGLNEDGRVLISGLSLVGKAYGDTASEIFSRCVTLGYFSPARENNAVLVSAVKDGGGTDEKMTKNVCSLFSKKFVEKKMRGVALTGIFDESLQAKAKEHGINTQKYALIQEYESLAQELGVASEIAAEEYKKISIREIYEKIEDLEERLKDAEVDKLEQNSITKAVEKITEIIENMEEGLQGKVQLEDIKERIEEAETVVECRVLVDELMDTLSGMKGPNAPNPANTRELIERAYAEIDAILKDIEKLNQKGGFTEEEHFEYREENFKDKEETPPAWDDRDVKDWQKENKDKYYNDWIKLKKEWDKDRWYD